MTTGLKLKCLAACFLASSAGSLAAAPIQWTVGSGGNDHWYELVADQVSWTTANAAANASSFLGLPGHLVTITSAAENDFIRDFVSVNDLAWIGLTDEASEGTFVWVTGEPVGFTNWNGGEPNDAGGGEDYAEFVGFTGCCQGTWNDLSNNSGGGRFYVVEYEAAANTPAPGTLALLGLGLLGLGFGRRALR